MAIRLTKVPGKNMGIKFREHKLAHDLLDGLTGIELGSAAHNSFNLPGSINVAPNDDFEFYKQGQVELCGEFAEVDHWAEAHALPFEDSSQDYVLSSHVFEHLPDPLAALREWNRVVKDGGLIFLIIPHRDALPEDVGLPLTTIDDVWNLQGVTVDSWNYADRHVPGDRRGHYHRYTHDSFQEIITALVEAGVINWTLVHSLPIDQKVSNGHEHVYRVNKPEPVEAENVDEEVDEEPAKPRRSRRKKTDQDV